MWGSFEKGNQSKMFLSNKSSWKRNVLRIFTFDNLNRHFLSFRQTSYATFTLYNVVNVFLVSHIRSTPPDLLRKKCSENMQQTYRRTPMSKGDFDKVTKKLYWNCTLAWLFSSKFTVYFQNTFSQEHLWKAASIICCSSPFYISH